MVVSVKSAVRYEPRRRETDQLRFLKASKIWYSGDMVGYKLINFLYFLYQGDNQFDFQVVHVQGKAKDIVQSVNLWTN